MVFNVAVVVIVVVLHMKIAGSFLMRFLSK